MTTNVVMARARLNLAVLVLKKAVAMHTTHAHRASLMQLARYVMDSISGHDAFLHDTCAMLMVIENNDGGQALTHGDVKQLLDVIITAIEDRIESISKPVEPIDQIPF